jgi:nicotinamide mononucleotide transporter PnuC
MTARRLLVIVAYAIGGLLSIGLEAGSVLHYLPFDWKEALGFITGAWGVWLQVRESHWNWPVQLISSAVYVVVFLQARLFADTMLNVIYVGLYLLGWYWWLWGGENRRQLRIGRTSLPFAATVTVVGALATAGMTVFLTRVNDSAPFLDALTTVVSLIALLMMGRKLIESWWVWIAVNCVYIGLYVYKDLKLTAVLYAIFAVLSVVGLIEWRRLLAAQESTPTEEAPAAATP